MQSYSDYAYRNDVVPHAAAYLIGPIESLCGELSPAVRVLEVGCRKGFYAGWFAAHGCTVVGIDADASGLELARRGYPTCRFERAAMGPGLLDRLGEDLFDLVVCAQRLDELDDPGAFVADSFEALRPGGRLVCAAPYSGYVREMAQAVSRVRRASETPTIGGAAALPWTRHSLGRMLHAAGFENIQFRAAGRVPLLWSAMIVAADRPLETLAARSEARPLVA